MKSKINKILKYIRGLNSRFELAEATIHKPEDRSVEIM